MGDVHVIGVPGLPEVRPGDDLIALLTPLLRTGRTAVRDGDVLCVSSKIVSKAAGLVAPAEQKDELTAAASLRRIARRRHGSVTTSVVLTRSGPVLAGAGIDASNAPDGILLLPEDPDGAAADLRRGLESALGRRLGVILTDTASRIWRIGVGDLALGASGVRVLEDLRGTRDDDGRPLGVTVRGLADELAAAADLVKGKTGRTPVAIIRGAEGMLTSAAEPDPGARCLNRTDASDWFPRPSLESVWQALGIPAEREPVAAMEPEADDVRVRRALEVALVPRGEAVGGTRDGQHPGIPAPAATARLVGSARIEVAPAAATPAAHVAAGALVERIRTALGAEAIPAPLGPVDVVLVPPDENGIMGA